ncbi:DUF6787 family protein [Pontibacter sp. G13]|uniref:DUF6787 family protein n=1 Tax=Pontibacter sp. G13 TaxID=3074898 RepID=UPI00288B4150|nr:DUF6787 family protein [Pontibacter sp. G13]WNJ20831.1 hypothetical protein RJD25_10135 [Pontibacter sp. G13]
MQQESWKKIWDVTIILVVFAVTGSTAALLPKWIMPLTGIPKGTFWYVVAYILLITPIYQVLLLGYAFLFGKFSYFLDKQKKIWRWITGRGRSQSQHSPINASHSDETDHQD